MWRRYWRSKTAARSGNAGPVDKWMKSESKIRRTLRQGQTLSGQLINAQPIYAFAKTMSSQITIFLLFNIITYSYNFDTRCSSSILLQWWFSFNHAISISMRIKPLTLHTLISSNIYFQTFKIILHLIQDTSEKDKSQLYDKLTFRPTSKNCCILRTNRWPTSSDAIALCLRFYKFDHESKPTFGVLIP